MGSKPLTNPYLIVPQIDDQNIRKNFDNLKKYFETQNQLLDFKFFEVAFTGAETGRKVAHGLTYIPYDILVTRVVGDGVVTFKYGSFDTSNIVMDATGAATIRFFAGTYSQGTSNPKTSPTDLGQYSSIPAFSDLTNVTYTVLPIPLTDTQIASGSYPSSTTAIYVIRPEADDIILATAPQTITLPSVSSMPGRILWIIKNDTNNFSSVTVLPANTGETVGKATSFVLSSPGDKMLIMASTSSSDWVLLQLVRKNPVCTRYTTGTGTHTPTAGCKYLVVKMCGGGGGGAGSATGATDGGSGGTGGTTTFGTSLLSCAGGGGGGGTSQPNGGTGGAATITTPGIGMARAGGQGMAGGRGTVVNNYSLGGGGGANMYGGSGSAGVVGAAGSTGSANSGAGGGGGSSGASGTTAGGGGGGSGGCIEAVVPCAASFAYAVGAGGTVGSVGTAGFQGGVGSAGVIEIWEYFL